MRVVFAALLLLSIYGVSCLGLGTVNQQYAKVVRSCETCDLTFRKVVEYDRHIAGKRHLEQLAKVPSPEQLWKEFSTGAPNWAADCVVGDILPLWSDSELSTLGFKYRSSCLHPSPVLSNLSPKQRARVWRYLRDVMGLSYFSEIAAVMASVDADPAGHLRVKEVFESFETYRKVANFIVNAQKTAKAIGAPPVDKIVELACGHGLVGALLAYRFPHLTVHLYDLFKRPTFDAFLRAFEKSGVIGPNRTSVLPNIIFHESDMGLAVEHVPNSFVICIHGCGEVNKRAIEMAQDHGAGGWVVLPCCIEKEMYLGSSCAVQLCDDTPRHVMLCGAMANEYGAQMIDSIDTRITNRAVVISGGVGGNLPESLDSEKDGPRIVAGSMEEDLRLAAKRRRMPSIPKLIRS
mmetsp:Transcript_30950/g.69026  ORF Transcript_30950/g.69026 Transcript_30950/m.69026 type:complete len:405 (+) Transcript_30950:42-1256(+)